MEKNGCHDGLEPHSVTVEKYIFVVSRQVVIYLLSSTYFLIDNTRCYFFYMPPTEFVFYLADSFKHRIFVEVVGTSHS